MGWPSRLKSACAGPVAARSHPPSLPSRWRLPKPPPKKGGLIGPRGDGTRGPYRASISLAILIGCLPGFRQKDLRDKARAFRPLADQLDRPFWEAGLAIASDL